VFWALSGDADCSILIGHDDETWDIAVIPIGAVDEILREVERHH